MKKYLIPTVMAAVLAASVVTAVAAKKEAVLMTVNGKDVPVSEFLYLYEKNNNQQTEPQTLDQYVDLFVRYKLKVADAEAAGIDTTQAFRKEYEGYCRDLAAPFMTDSTVIDSLLTLSYDHMKRMRKVSHIMMPLGKTPEAQLRTIALLDSLRTEILAGRADFADVAARYSSDRSARTNGGSMGWVSGGQLPWRFEDALYNTPIDSISRPFDDAPYGFHILRVEGEKSNPGQVHARHILKLTRGLSPEAAAAKKAEIDSIYTVLMNGGDFDAIAKEESEDPGSAKAGGMLDWFGPRQMVPEFEEVAFGQPTGAISKPFATSYGYHIVQTLGHRDMMSFEQAKPNIMKAMEGDQRNQEPKTKRLEQLWKKYNARVDTAAVSRIIRERIDPNDSIRAIQLLSDWTTVGTVGTKKVSLDDAAKLLHPEPMSRETAANQLRRAINIALTKAVEEYAMENLAKDDPNYGNLINEYRDGMLLFEISNRRVWDKGTRDREGLKAFFEKNRERYTWDAPKYKAIIVSATNDSIASAAERYLNENPTEVDSLVLKLRGQFGRNVKVERKVMARGEDPYIDFLGFGGPKPAPEARWKAFFQYEGKMLNAPEEPTDDRARIVTDYQEELEREWIAEMEKKYPVKINKKELKKLKDSGK